MDHKHRVHAQSEKQSGKPVTKKNRVVAFLMRKKKHHGLNEEYFSEQRIYYERIADRYHLLRSLAALLLAGVMILIGLMSYGFLEQNQFRYLYKIWRINPVSMDRQYNDIAYAAGNGAKFVFYKNDLAVIEGGKIAVYDLSGDRSFRAEANNSAQAFAASDRYVALYTPGDKRFVMYDSFSSVYEHTFDYPIRLAAVSDSGNFAVCLREEERVVVEVYNQNSVKECAVTLEKDAVIYDLDLSPNGDKLAITTIEGGTLTGAGNYHTNFSLWDVSSEKELFHERIAGKKPIATSFFNNIRMYFAAEGSLIFCQTNGKVSQTVETPSPCTVVSDDRSVAVSDGASGVTVYSTKGEKRTEFALSEKMLDMKVKDGSCYVFSGRSISLYDDHGQKKGDYEIKSGVLSFFIPDDGSILICYVSETKRIVP
ncbi:MAG: WD40 repeat domain-containing protein [Clostridia bacterium]|nr:WD40 repeat domain-containing protein [Clostridia bacterium]